MHIQALQLKNFKRFTNLKVQDIPENTKLVLLIGSNGSGKSCVFDAFAHLENLYGKDYKDAALTIQKDKKQPSTVLIHTHDHGKNGIEEGKGVESGLLTGSNFYGRTSFRQVPRLTRRQLGAAQFNMKGDGDRAASFIDRDERFENDLEHLFGKLLKEFFRTNEDKSEIKEKIINPINEALYRIFNKGNGTALSLLEIIPPLEGNVAEINFKKGNSVFHYNYLSAGEKEVFNILINLIARREYYQDTVYYMDEVDLHLNTSLQYNFIKEISENWIPPNCQLWTASHSLGFIEYANKALDAVVIDFDDLDFDLPQVLVPEAKDNAEVYEIAVGKDFLPSLFKDKDIYFVENKDRDFYALIGLDNAVFVSDNNRNNVYHKVRTSSYKGIVDRDFLSDEDIIEIRKEYERLYILQYYSIENYLYHPDNLNEYYTARNVMFDKSQYISDLIEAKNKCKNEIIPGLSLKRTEYPYFGEPEFNGKPVQHRFKNKQENLNEATKVAGYLNSDDFEVFYKSLPMKTYCTALSQRQHINKADLAKTVWFKQQLSKVIGG
ncbi:AAA family ATPase [Chitinophaga sp. sic0106]|uniref:AAA family ATPase n=1 Tax=Chitinophaga sp. sic0106 TaxID=2854785 RepID=UPI001C447843|nr:AAA family ATPase [Chitinophaga sp. sic0106]MBV7529795.1 ATP-binding protein [Chitinophaga sp. sic0106]